MNKHAMTIEGRGKKRKVKTTKKSSAVSRQLRATQRLAWNVLGGIGLITMVLVLVRLAQGGW